MDKLYDQCDLCGMPNEIDVVIPVYNEELLVVRETLKDLAQSCKDIVLLNIIVVNDASDKRYELESLKSDQDIHYIEHSVNRGYGSALKTGIRCGKNEWIAIIDADGTYPSRDLPILLEALGNGADMIVGARIGDICEIPMLRRFPKRMLNSLSSYMAKTKIKDLNSGMRLFKRDLCNTFWNLLPNRFSFTSTITMAAISSGRRVREVPINYHKRVGPSSIHPIKDTIKFVNIILKMGMLFYPMRLFAPLSISLFSFGFFKGFLRDYVLTGAFGNVSVFLMIAALQIMLMGYLAELVVAIRILNVKEVR